MYRLLLPSLLQLFLVSICSGQMPNLKAGLNVSTITSPSSANEFQAGFYAGVSGLKKINKSIDLKVELLYSKQGAKGGLNERARYNYLNMPLIISIYLGQDFYFDLGVQTGIILNATVANENDKQNITAELNTLDFALCSGVSYSLNEFLKIETRLNYGLTNSVRFPIPEGSYRNMVFQAGLIFNLKKNRDETN
jgi:hypothetical protein